jgi:hypothetical protein
MELFLVIVILLQILSSFAFAYSDGPTAERLIKAAGSREQFLVELSEISAYASSLRHGLQNSLDGEWLYGAQGIVVPITFEDGVKWAAKVSDYSPESINSAIMSLRAIERYCPDIPVPRVQGIRGSFISNSAIIYYITEWMEGECLWGDEQAFQCVQLNHQTSMNESVPSFNVTLSEKLVTQLAEFVYNLTTCPISHSASKFACYLADWW